MYHPLNVKQVIKWQEGEIHSSRTATEIRFQYRTVIPHGHLVQTEHLIKCWCKTGTGLCTCITRKYTVICYYIGFVPCILFSSGTYSVCYMPCNYYYYYCLCLFFHTVPRRHLTVVFSSSVEPVCAGDRWGTRSAEECVQSSRHAAGSSPGPSPATHA